MGFFNRREEPKSIGELDAQLERSTLVNEITTKDADTAEKEAVIRELKKQYGPNWAKRLGVGKLTDLTSLKSFLRGARKGLEKAGSASNSAINPGNFSGMRKA